MTKERWSMEILVTMVGSWLVVIYDNMTVFALYTVLVNYQPGRKDEGDDNIAKVIKYAWRGHFASTGLGCFLDEHTTWLCKLLACSHYVSNRLLCPKARPWHKLSLWGKFNFSLILNHGRIANHLVLGNKVYIRWCYPRSIPGQCSLCSLNKYSNVARGVSGVEKLFFFSVVFFTIKFWHISTLVPATLAMRSNIGSLEVFSAFMVGRSKHISCWRLYQETL